MILTEGTAVRLVFEMLAALSLLGGAPPSSSPRHPGFIDAPALAALCTASAVDEPQAPAICLGYIVGAVDQLFVDYDGAPRRSCLPDHVTPEDIVTLVQANALVAANAADVGAADFLRALLEEAYPCAVA